MYGLILLFCHIARIREILNPPPLEEENPDHA